jgi:hypothetical protein
MSNCYTPISTGTEDTAREKFLGGVSTQTMDVSDIMISWTATPVTDTARRTKKRGWDTTVPQPNGKFDAIEV